MITDTTRLDDLAQFLRSRRNRLRPENFGIAAGGRRRAAGLRREEVADAAGISTTWYVWLEQGRDVKASPHALRSLGKALRLSRSEQAYLFQLARPDLDWRNRLGKQEMPTPALLRLLDGLAPHPAYILNRYWQVVACNRPAQFLLGDFAENDEWSGSLIAKLFLDQHWRERFVDWQIIARSAVAQFRLATAAIAGDPVVVSLISLLEAASEKFAEWWNAHELADSQIWQKTIRHPLLGEMCFNFATLRPSGRDGDFFLSVYTPLDETARERFMSILASDSADKRIADRPA